MKTLSEIMMCDFVDMTCGKVRVVLHEGESASEEQIAEHVRRLIVDYKMIVNSSAMKSVIYNCHIDRLRQAKMALLTICLNLIAIGHVENVYSPLLSVGYHLQGLPEETIRAKLNSELRRLRYEQKRSEQLRKNEIDALSPDKDEIRASFDKEIAMLMSYFKMSIDIRSITASVYANLVAQADRELKANKKMIDRMRR